MIKTLIAAAVIFASTFSFGRTCSASGQVHLTYPTTTVYCEQKGRILWALTYDVDAGLFVMTNTKTGDYWFQPPVANSNSGGSATLNGKNVHFNMQTGVVENDWVAVAFTGVD
jgi:hypothetical protein